MFFKFAFDSIPLYRVLPKKKTGYFQKNKLGSTVDKAIREICGTNLLLILFLFIGFSQKNKLGSTVDTSVETGWRNPIGCLIFIGHFGKRAL